MTQILSLPVKQLIHCILAQSRVLQQASVLVQVSIQQHNLIWSLAIWNSDIPRNPSGAWCGFTMETDCVDPPAMDKWHWEISGHISKKSQQILYRKTADATTSSPGTPFDLKSLDLTAHLQQDLVHAPSIDELCTQCQSGFILNNPSSNLSPHPPVYKCYNMTDFACIGDEAINSGQKNTSEDISMHSKHILCANTSNTTTNRIVIIDGSPLNRAPSTPHPPLW